jgi:hypothetical protein
MGTLGNEVELKNKYHVAPAEERTVDGIVFHSKREAQHYIQFRALEKGGAIQKLEIQVPFALCAHGGLKHGHGLAYAEYEPTAPPVPIAKYIADFVVTERDGSIRIYDSKGFRTPEFKLKKKLFEANYPYLRIVEI